MLCGTRFHTGVDASFFHTEANYVQFISLLMWDDSIGCLTSGETMAWKIAAKAAANHPPANYLVQGVLALLQFLIQREKAAMDMIVSLLTRGEEEEEEEGPIEGTIDALQARIEIDNGSLHADRGYNIQQFENWNCSQCTRELGNMFLECEKCTHNKEHLVCTDCFFAARHCTTRDKTTGKQWPNNGMAHTRKHKSHPKYTVKFRFIHVNESGSLVDQCRSQLSSANLSELPETKDAIEYLWKYQRKIEAKYVPAVQQIMNP